MSTIGQTELPIAPAAPALLSRMGGLFHRHETWVLIDQGIVSLGNFLSGLYVTRGLSQSEFGAYQVLFDTMLYLNGLQSGLIIYPLLVKGATYNDRKRLGQLATASILFTFGMLPFLGGATVVAVRALGNPNVAVAAVLAVFLWQLQETLRRGLMSDLRFGDAIWGDAISYLGQATLIILLSAMQMLDINRAFLVMALTSMAAVVVQSFQIGLRPLRIWELRLVARDFWRLGRWQMLTNGSGIITSLGYSWTLLAWWGTSATAVFGAMAQALKLANPVINSMGGLITPTVARASATSGTHSASKAAIRYSALGVVMLAPYFLALLIFATPVLRFLSRGDKPYVEFANLLRLYVLNYAAIYLTNMVGAWLAGLGRPRFNFYVQIIDIAATLLIGLPLTIHYGVYGLVIGALTAAVLSAVTAGVFIFRLTRHPTGGESPATPTA